MSNGLKISTQSSKEGHLVNELISLGIKQKEASTFLVVIHDHTLDLLKIFLDVIY